MHFTNPELTKQLIERAFRDQFPDPDARQEAELRALREIESKFGLYDCDLTYKFFVDDDGRLGFHIFRSDEVSGSN